MPSLEVREIERWKWIMWTQWAIEARDLVILVVLFGVTIFVHELGHFLVARAKGLVVETFSLGFGPAIWKRRIGGTTYRIGWFPVGGYVSLPQLDPEAMALLQGSSTRAGPLPPVSAGAKIAVSLAGAAGNLLLAVAIAWLVYAVGMPLTTEQQDTVVGYVDRHSAAFAAGLRTGDRVLAVNATPVATWGQFIQEVSLHDRVTLRVRGSEGADRTVEIPTEPWEEFAIRTISGISSRNTCRVAAVTPGWSAADAGIRPGDVIVAFAGVPVLSRGHLVDLVAEHREQAVPVTVRREAGGPTEEKTLIVTPRWDERAGMTRIGIEFSRDPLVAASDVRIHPRPGRQLKHHAATIVRFLRHLVTPRVARRAAEQVGGPVAIISYYVGIIKASLMLAIWFTGFLNVNLAVINLLPIPVLDGGHILFALWELATRRPPHPRVVHALVNAFAVLLVGLMIFLSVRDLDRFTPVGRRIRPFLGSRSGAAAEPSASAQETHTAAGPEQGTEPEPAPPGMTGAVPARTP